MKTLDQHLKEIGEEAADRAAEDFLNEIFHRLMRKAKARRDSWRSLTHDEVEEQLASLAWEELRAMGIDEKDRGRLYELGPTVDELYR